MLENGQTYFHGKYKFQTHFSFRTQINFVIVLIIKYTRSESLKNLSTT